MIYTWALPFFDLFSRIQHSSNVCTVGLRWNVHLCIHINRAITVNTRVVVTHTHTHKWYRPFKSVKFLNKFNVFTSSLELLRIKLSHERLFLYLQLPGSIILPLFHNSQIYFGICFTDKINTGARGTQYWRVNNRRGNGDCKSRSCVFLIHLLRLYYACEFNDIIC